MALFVLTGCGDAPEATSSPATEAPSAPRAAAAGREPARGPEPRRGRERAAAPRVLFLGTSLTAGYGLSEEEAYPARVAELLQQRGRPIRAVNAGVSGDTSAGGLNRIDWLLRAEPDVVLVELGANDGLRGLPVSMTEANLREVIARARRAGAEVIVAGMMMPPNYGEQYAREFRELFPRVATDTGSILVPFLLEGVAAVPELNLPDGIHPNEQGQRVVAETVLPYVAEALEAR